MTIFPRIMGQKSCSSHHQPECVYPPLMDYFPIETAIYTGFPSQPCLITQGYPLVIQHSYGTSPFFMRKVSISVAIFNSYVSHFQRVFIPSNFIKPPFSYGFPMVFLWFHPPWGLTSAEKTTEKSWSLPQLQPLRLPPRLVQLLPGLPCTQVFWFCWYYDVLCMACIHMLLSYIHLAHLNWCVYIYNIYIYMS